MGKSELKHAESSDQGRGWLDGKDVGLCADVLFPEVVCKCVWEVFVLISCFITPCHLLSRYTK